MPWPDVSFVESCRARGSCSWRSESVNVVIKVAVLPDFLHGLVAVVKDSLSYDQIKFATTGCVAFAFPFRASSLCQVRAQYR